MAALVPENIPILVMRSLENARKCLADGDAPKCIKMCQSTDELCQKVEAPPPIHGLCLTVLGDSLMQNGQPEEAREVLLRGIKLNKSAESRPGMPEPFKIDLQHRLGDLYAALGGVERSQGNWKEATRALRASVDYFEKSGKKELMCSSMLGVATVQFARGEVKDALNDLEEIELEVAKTENPQSPECSMLLANTIMNQGHCHLALGDKDKAKGLFETAKGIAEGSGDTLHAEKITELLGSLSSGEAPTDENAFTN